MIHLRYFAGLRDAAGKSEETIDRDHLTVKELIEWAEDNYADFKNTTIMVAVNEEYARLEDTIQDGDVVAFIPPVSGG
ncbi:Molybdopterin synthase sulfur carrier subunit [compost metagenome]